MRTAFCPARPCLLPAQSSARSRMVSTADKCRRRCRILDHAGKAFRQPERLAQPVDHFRLELGGCRRGLPEHALRRHHRDQIFGNDRDGRGIGREIGEEARMLPVRHAGHDGLFEIGEDRLHRLGRLGRRWRDLRGDVAGRGVGAHRPVAQARAIVGAPVGRPVRPRTKLVPIQFSLPGQLGAAPHLPAGILSPQGRGEVRWPWRQLSS